MREQTSVAFKISSTTLTAEQITAAIGLKPDVSWKTGTPRGAFGATEKANGWVLESALQHFNTLDEHIKAMLKRLAPAAGKIGALGAAVSVELTASLQRKNTAPPLHFDRDDLRWLASMNSRLDIDTQVFRDEPPRTGGAKAGGAETPK